MKRLARHTLGVPAAQAGDGGACGDAMAEGDGLKRIVFNYVSAV
jgi:hypothetical protein